MDSDSDDWDPSLRKPQSKQRRSTDFMSPWQASSRIRLSLSSSRNSTASKANTSTANSTLQETGLLSSSANVTEEILLDSSGSEASSPKRPKLEDTAKALNVRRKSDCLSRPLLSTEPSEHKSVSEPESDFTFTFETQELRTEMLPQVPKVPQIAAQPVITRKSRHTGQTTDVEEEQKSQSALESEFTFTFETRDVLCLGDSKTSSEATTEPFQTNGEPLHNDKVGAEPSKTDLLVNDEDDMFLESLLDPEKRNTIQDWIDKVETASSVSAPSIASNCSRSTVRPTNSIASESTLSEEATQPLVFEGMKTPSKRPADSSSKSPCSKQTTITAFYSARGTPSPAKIIPEESSPAEENQGPLAVVREHAKSAWSSLMSRMRGTASTVREALQISESTVETTSAPTGRTCPFYKKIPTTNFVVDAFSYGRIPGVTGYFLTHFHYDHYGGLGNWLDKPLYCSQVTANLVKLKLRLNYNLIKPIPLNESRIIENVEVIALDANHCPGAVMFLFRPLSGKTYLHVGDFRAHPDMEKCPHLKFSPIDQLFLDTTYCSEQWSFPPQDDVVDYIKGLVRDRYEKLGRKLLIVCGSYTIGKEKVFRAAAEEVGSKIWAPPQKRRVLNCLDDPELSRSVVTDPRCAQVHVVNMGDLAVSNLQKYLAELEPVYTHILALKPTGWEYDQSASRKGLEGIPVQSYGRIQVCGVPYSEHSSYEELRRFVKYFRPTEITPTVNVGSQKARNHMKDIFERWMKEPTSSYSDSKQIHRVDDQEFIQLMKNSPRSNRRGRGGGRPRRKMQFAK